MASNRISEQTVWDFFVTLFNGNEYAAAGACGNMQSESGLYTDNCENSWNSLTGISDEQATQNCNDGTWDLDYFLYDNTTSADRSAWWVNSYGWGYGLSQWTTTARRTRLWELTIDSGYDIDNGERQLLLIEEEFNGSYSSVKEAMINATSIEQATRIYCNRYEVGTWSDSRLENANYFYNTYAGGGTGYFTTINVEGNGTATASPVRAEEGATVTLTAVPSTGATFDGFTVISGGVTIDTPSLLQATFVMGTSNVVIQASFSGGSPTPTPTGEKTKKHKMPIWMYPSIRFR